MIVKELINGEPGSAQAIIQRVCAEVGGAAPCQGCHERRGQAGQAEAYHSGACWRALARPCPQPLRSPCTVASAARHWQDARNDRATWHRRTHHRPAGRDDQAAAAGDRCVRVLPGSAGLPCPATSRYPLLRKVVALQQCRLPLAELPHERVVWPAMGVHGHDALSQTLPNTHLRASHAAGATIQIDQGGDPCRVTVAGQPSSADQVRRRRAGALSRPAGSGPRAGSAPCLAVRPVLCRPSG